MPLLPYVNRLEPVDDAAIWRYLDLRKFRDLIASEELYFRRADLFTDKSEGCRRSNMQCESSAWTHTVSMTA